MDIYLLEGRHPSQSVARLNLTAVAIALPQPPQRCSGHLAVRPQTRRGLGLRLLRGNRQTSIRDRHLVGCRPARRSLQKM